MATKKTTPEKPPSKPELSKAGAALAKPGSASKATIKTLAGRVLGEGRK